MRASIQTGSNRGLATGGTCSCGAGRRDPALVAERLPQSRLDIVAQNQDGGQGLPRERSDRVRSLRQLVVRDHLARGSAVDNGEGTGTPETGRPRLST
jgi:hypothetical protein